MILHAPRDVRNTIEAQRRLLMNEFRANKPGREPTSQKALPYHRRAWRVCQDFASSPGNGLCRVKSVTGMFLTIEQSTRSDTGLFFMRVGKSHPAGEYHSGLPSGLPFDGQCRAALAAWGCRQRLLVRQAHL